MDKKSDKTIAIKLLDDLEDELEIVDSVDSLNGPKNIEKANSTEDDAEPDSSTSDATVRLDDSYEVDFSDPSSLVNPKPFFETINHDNVTHVADSNKKQVEPSPVGRTSSSMASLVNSTEVALAQSESLNIAQKKISELEVEVEKLRLENEELIGAAQTYRNKTDSLKTKVEDLENRLTDEADIHKNEKAILEESLSKKDQQTEELREKVDELEARLSTSVKKIRNRERELENRLELIKMENSTLVRSKDDYLLELKRQVDQLNAEIGNYRKRSQELHQMISDKKEVIRRTVKALRLALTLMESGDSKDGRKKVG